MLVCVFLCDFAHETAGAARIRLSLRPLTGEGVTLMANLGRIAPRDREVVCADKRYLEIESVDAHGERKRNIPQPVITRESG